MILECRHCGAPLDVKDGAELTKCRYCGSVNERQRMRTIAAETPRDFRPPRQWSPPPQFPVEAPRPLQYHGGGTGLLFKLVLLFFIVGVIVIGVVARRMGGASSGTTMFGSATGEVLARASLEQSPAGLAKQLSGRAAETSVYVPLGTDRFEYASFSWDAADLSHPTSFYLSARKGRGPDERVRTALSGRLNGGIDDNGIWNWEGVHLVHQKDGAIGGGVKRELSHAPNPHWKRQFQALWKLVVGVALDQPVALTPEELELLGAGYPLAQLATFDPATPVDKAVETVQKKFRGAVAGTFITLDVRVAVDHPLLRDARLSWKNEKGAQLSTVHLSPTRAFEARREAFVACLKELLGAPEVHERDYLKKKNDYRFSFPQTWLWIHESSVSLNSRRDHLEAADWSRAVRALAHCR